MGFLSTMPTYSDPTSPRLAGQITASPAGPEAPVANVWVIYLQVPHFHPFIHSI